VIEGIVLKSDSHTVKPLFFALTSGFIIEEGFPIPDLERIVKTRWLLDSNLRRGDKIIVSGTIGDHSVAILSFMEGYDFGSEIVSDVAPLNHLIISLLNIGGIVKPYIFQRFNKFRYIDKN